MSGCKFLLIVSLLTSHRSASQENPKINISLTSHDITYSVFSCPSVLGMIQGKDHLMLSGNLTISGFDSAFKATFGLLVEQDIHNRLATQIQSSSCKHISKVKMDTCACMYRDNIELRFRCNLTASCKMTERLYFYMNFSNTYYYTKSIAILKTHARCESPPGPFSECFNGKEKRTITKPFNRSQARYSCRTGLLHGVDRFNMNGRINLNHIPLNAVIEVQFCVVPRNDNTSITYLGTQVQFRHRKCLPLDRSVVNSCGCLGHEVDGFSVVCTFLASVEHSQKFGFFRTFIEKPYYYYTGDYVRMPLVLDECEEMPSPQSESQDQQKINISLRHYVIDYSNFTCQLLEGLIQGADQMVLTGKLSISGLNSPLKATFGLVAEHDSYNHLVTQTEIQGLNCPQLSQVEMDTCACTYLDMSELGFTCKLMATCKMSGNLYFYVYYNNTYYYSESVSILKIYARCESPPGPFSVCVNGKEKRCVTNPFDHLYARKSCINGLLHGVDYIQMTGRVNLENISTRSKIFVNFGVAFRNDNRSVTFLGTAIDFLFRDCLPLKQNVPNSCACLGVETDGFRVVCKFLASLIHSQKFGFFQMSVDGRKYVGDFVRMPSVLGDCQDVSEIPFLARLMYITIISLLVLIMAALLYSFAKVSTSSEERVEERSDMHSNVDGQSSVDTTGTLSSDKSDERSEKESYEQSQVDAVSYGRDSSLTVSAY